jgi:hypothetical protein
MKGTLIILAIACAVMYPLIMAIEAALKPLLSAYGAGV